MILQERAKRLQESLSKIGESEEEMAEARGYEAIRSEVERLLQLLTEQLSTVNVLVAHGELSPKSLSSAKKSKEVWQRIDDRFSGRNREELRRGRDLTTLRDRVERLVEESARTARNEWSRLRRDRATGLPPNLLRSLENVPGQEEAVGRVRQISQEAMEIPIPTTAEDYSTFVSLCDRLARAVQQLGHEGIPKSVLSFFQACNSQEGATYDTLGQEVVQWLEARGLLEHLRIRYAGR